MKSFPWTRCALLSQLLESNFRSAKCLRQRLVFMPCLSTSIVARGSQAGTLRRSLYYKARFVAGVFEGLASSSNITCNHCTLPLTALTVFSITMPSTCHWDVLVRSFSLVRPYSGKTVYRIGIRYRSPAGGFGWSCCTLMRKQKLVVFQLCGNNERVKLTAISFIVIQ